MDVINEEILAMMKGDESSYYSVDCLGEDSQMILPEYLNQLKSANLPNHALHLKTNATVMFCRNLNVAQGLCNGTRARVIRCLVSSNYY